MVRTACFLLMMGLLLSGLSFSQPAIDVRDVAVNMEPVRKSGVSESDFQKAEMILDQTLSSTKGNPSSFNVADFWNLAIVFRLLDYPTDYVEAAFTEAAAQDPDALCDYIESLGGGKLEAAIPEVFQKFVRDHCHAPSGSIAHRKPKATNELAKLIMEIKKRDQQYRHQSAVPWEKQRPLDLINQSLIDSLYSAHGEYIGKTKVGKDLDYVMWSVIQHSNPEMMERYLPVVQKATSKGEISSTVCLKMLLDRVYAARTGTQIFGSQEGVPLAQKSIRENLAAEYGL